MKISLLLLLLTITLSAQQWIELNPKFSQYSIDNMKFKDELTGYLIIGDALWKTTDGGNTINMIDDPGYPGYRQIYLFGDTVLVYAPKKLLRSVDGITFDSVTISFEQGFKPGSSFFLNSQWGVISGIFTEAMTTFRKTTNGGLTWTTVNAPVYTSQMYFADFMYGVAATNDHGTWKTTNGGNTWTVLIPGAFNYSWLYYHKNIVVISNYTDGFFVSTDYGQTFTRRDFNPNCDNLLINDSFMVACVTYSSRYFKISYDNGITWQRYRTPGQENPSMEAINDSVFYIGGERGALYKTTNKGSKWICKTAPSFYLKHVAPVDENICFAGGENLMRTSDGGITWEILYTKPGFWGEMYFINATTGFAQFSEINELFDIVSSTFLKTTDRGDKWDTLYSMGSGYDNSISKILFKDSNHGYAIGYGNGFGLYYTTSDGGNNWDFHPGSNISGSDINFLDNDRGYICGSSKGFFTTDGGSVWIQKPDFYGETILFVDTLTGFKGHIWDLQKTTDGGNTFFDIINHGQNDSFSELTFWGKNTGVVHFHYHETIIKTTDQGNTWYTIFSFMDYERNFKMRFLNERLAWVAGGLGKLYKYTENLIPVELVTFTASSEAKKVLLKWSTSTETNNRGFTVMRRFNEEKWSELTFIKGAGTTSEKKNYTFEDNVSSAGKYYYKLRQIDFNGTIKEDREVTVTVSEIPSDFILYQNYPNPFNPVTKIKYALLFESSTCINIYNSIGQLVKTIFPGNEKAGLHEITFDASGLASGIYFYSLRANSPNGKSFNAVNKMLYLK